MLTGTPGIVIVAAIIAFGALGYIVGELLVSWHRAWRGRQ